jgi:hypothetical protein
VIAGTVTDNGVPIIMLLVAGQTWQGIRTASKTARIHLPPSPSGLAGGPWR